MIHHQTEEEPPARAESVLLTKIRHKNTQWSAWIVGTFGSLHICVGSEFGRGALSRWLCSHIWRHVTHNWNRIIGRHCCWNRFNSIHLKYITKHLRIMYNRGRIGWLMRQKLGAVFIGIRYVACCCVLTAGARRQRLLDENTGNSGYTFGRAGYRWYLRIWGRWLDGVYILRICSRRTIGLHSGRRRIVHV